jgi:hypothetical protein
LHHGIAYECDEGIEGIFDYLNGTSGSCFVPPSIYAANYCSKIVFAWAVGGIRVTLIEFLSLLV